MFIRVDTEEQTEEVEKLANEIWREHYIPIIGERQVEYMLKNFQSKKAIQEQLNNCYNYYLIYEENKNIGYAAIQFRRDELFLSKIYIKSSERGKGYAKKTIQFIEETAKNNNLKKITLTVNKNNSNTIKVYEKIGFKIVEPIVMDIGGGFIMDDYLMEKELQLFG